MSDRAPLLLEIGCEEIPARMIRAAAADLERRVVSILAGAGLEHGDPRRWGGSRRLAVRVEAVAGRQADRDERVLGPPAAVAFGADGSPTRAALGFAKKQGVEPGALLRIETERGEYVGLERRVEGASLGALLARELPAAVAGMSFPKSMRWAEGRHRWVRPVHWLVALHGERQLELELFGIAAGRRSSGHRFLSDGPVEIEHADAYEDALRAGRVLVDADERRARVVEGLAAEAAALADDGRPVDDPGLLDEVVDLVEWPGIVGGRFEPSYLELPEEILVVTLRHHQKCFSLRGAGGRLEAGFLAVANTDRDRAGHVRRGNEWVVGGRLEDARFFWAEDRGRTIDSLAPRLARVVFHARVGSFADKARRTERLARAIGEAVGLPQATVDAAARAAAVAKVDLLTGTVGEFPELQGQVGGLLLAAEGVERDVADAVYEQYRPVGPDDAIPGSDAGCVVALADKLDTIASLIAAGEVPTSSRDPLGLRRASAGVFRILLERRWPLTPPAIVGLVEGDDTLERFLTERLANWFRDRGATAGEIAAVLAGGHDRPLHDVAARLEAIAGVRERDDFARLVELTKRVDTILQRNDELLDGTGDATASPAAPPAAASLVSLVGELGPLVERAAARGAYEEVVGALARLVEPVDRLFEDVLVIDPQDPAGTRGRCRLLAELRSLVTRDFDIRELAGEAKRTN